MKIHAHLSALLILLLGACTSPRYHDHRFQPAPLEVEVGTDAVAGSEVRTLVTVIGIERAGEGHGARAVVRMRLENLGTAPAKLETTSLSLVSADLEVFERAEVAAVEPPESSEGEIGAARNATFDLLFPLPQGRKTSEIDLSGLNLRFTVRFGEHAATVGATFRLIEWGYWDPGYPRVSIGVGYGWCD